MPKLVGASHKMKTSRMAVISAELFFFVSQKDVRGKICFAFLSLSPPSKCYFSICIVAHYTPLRRLHGRTQTLPHTNCIQKITSLPCRLKITSVPHHPTNHSPGLLFPLLSPSLLPCFTILVFSLHLNSALNCQA